MKICNRGRKESCLQRYFRIAASTKIEISVKFNPLRKKLFESRPCQHYECFEKEVKLEAPAQF